MLQPASTANRMPDVTISVPTGLIAENARLREEVRIAEARLAEAEARIASLESGARTRKDEEALHRSVLEAALDCIVTIDERSRVVEWNAASERTFGFTRGEALGRDLAELIIPLHLREGHRRGVKRFLSTGEGAVVGRRIEIEARRSDGKPVIVELAICPMLLDGRRHFTAYLRDISERVRSECALKESEARLRATCEHALVGIGEVDTAGRFLRVNEQFSVITGYDRSEITDRAFLDLTHPEDRERDARLFEKLMAGETDSYTIEKRYFRRGGEAVWIEVAASRVDDCSGKPLYGVRIVRDITERKRSEALQTLLIDELNHRVKNTLATVQAIVVQALRTDAEPADMRAAIEGRLMALARVHDVLARETWQGARLREVLMQAVEPFSDPGAARISIEGPEEVWLPPRAALALAMAAQELVTNAVKYGALSQTGGAVSIKWSAEQRESGRRLVFCWQETGGPRVQPPRRRGFGSRLLERGIAGQLGGMLDLTFASDGVRCLIDMPLD